MKTLHLTLKKQDEIIGRLTREVEELRDRQMRSDEWIRKAKIDAGYSQSDSFDDVWKDALLALKEQEKNNPF